MNTLTIELIQLSYCTKTDIFFFRMAELHGG